MDIFVKICGMTSGDDARRVAGMRPNAVGFVFWNGSKRYVEPQTVGDWETAEGVERVGVFVDADPEAVAEAAKQARLDVVQLHGSEDPSEYSGIGTHLWKILHLEDLQDELPQGKDLEAFLIDSRTATMPGGTGMTCDWVAAAEFVRRSQKPVLLAGGLAPANVERALDSVKPWGVDVSTGVESAAGKKDLKLVEEFILRCRMKK